MTRLNRLAFALGIILAASFLGAQSFDGYGSQFVRVDHSNRIDCRADNIGTTKTVLTNCAAPGAGLSIYVTDIIAQSTTATGGNFSLQHGTGGACGTGSTAFLPPIAGTHLAPANTSVTGPFQIHYQIPRKVLANNELCVTGVVTNTTNVNVIGFIAP
jgi:hypothetical protein